MTSLTELKEILSVSLASRNKGAVMSYSSEGADERYEEESLLGIDGLSSPQEKLERLNSRKATHDETGKHKRGQLEALRAPTLIPVVSKSEGKDDDHGVALDDMDVLDALEELKKRWIQSKLRRSTSPPSPSTSPPSPSSAYDETCPSTPDRTTTAAQTTTPAPSPSNEYQVFLEHTTTPPNHNADVGNMPDAVAITTPKSNQMRGNSLISPHRRSPPMPETPSPLARPNGIDFKIIPPSPPPLPYTNSPDSVITTMRHAPTPSILSTGGNHLIGHEPPLKTSLLPRCADDISGSVPSHLNDTEGNNKLDPTISGAMEKQGGEMVQEAGLLKGKRGEALKHEQKKEQEKKESEKTARVAVGEDATNRECEANNPNETKQKSNAKAQPNVEEIGGEREGMKGKRGALERQPKENVNDNNERTNSELEECLFVSVNSSSLSSANQRDIPSKNRSSSWRKENLLSDISINSESSAFEVGKERWAWRPDSISSLDNNSAANCASNTTPMKLSQKFEPSGESADQLHSKEWQQQSILDWEENYAAYDGDEDDDTKCIGTSGESHKSVVRHLRRLQSRLKHKRERSFKDKNNSDAVAALGDSKLHNREQLLSASRLDSFVSVTACGNDAHYCVIDGTCDTDPPILRFEGDNNGKNNNLSHLEILASSTTDLVTPQDKNENASDTVYNDKSTAYGQGSSLDGSVEEDLLWNRCNYFGSCSNFDETIHYDAPPSPSSLSSTSSSSPPSSPPRPLDMGYGEDSMAWVFEDAIGNCSTCHEGAIRTFKKNANEMRSSLSSANPKRCVKFRQPEVSRVIVRPMIPKCEKSEYFYSRKDFKIFRTEAVQEMQDAACNPCYNPLACDDDDDDGDILSIFDMLLHACGIVSYDKTEKLAHSPLGTDRAGDM